MATAYVWSGFRLVYDGTTGAVHTHYPDGTVSGCGPVPEDAEHGALLGLTPGEHRLAHEMAHHLCALASGVGDDRQGCPIVRADALRQPMPPDADTLEHRITAFTYYALDCQHRHAHEFGALADLHRMDVDLPALAARFRWLFAASAYAKRVDVA